jgi:hypothetical protein
VLGIELPAPEQAAIDAYVASRGQPPDRSALTASHFWQREAQDGRSSAAMVELIERIRVLRTLQHDIHLVAFDVPEEQASKPSDAGARDVAMSRNILAARDRFPTARFLVLTGGIHARTTVGVPWDAAFVPMGHHLAQALPKLTSLEVQYPPGRAWVCSSARASDCGDKPVGATRQDLGDVPFLEMASTPSPEGYSGVFYAGHISASAPARNQAPGEP